MINNTPKTQVLTNVNNVTNMGMETSPEAFGILSDAIYEHKVAAVVRELSCNAYDSHVDAGKSDAPIQVIFPNSLNPYFVVEDQGLGLDDEGVRDVFLTYFKSTKRDTNTQTGFLGLGSKSPLAYSGSFSITARKDGMEREYYCYLGEDDCPCVNKVHETNTDEPNGVRVSVPVEADDIKMFCNEAMFIFSFFDTVPETQGDLNFSVLLPDAVKSLEENGTYVINTHWNGSSLYRCSNDESLFVNMGNVCYRVSYNELFGVDNDGARDREVETFFQQMIHGGCGYIIRVPMGSVKFQASRERLSLKPDTVKFLRKKFLEDTKKKIAAIQAEIDGFDHIHTLLLDKNYRQYIDSTILTFKKKPLCKWKYKVSGILCKLGTRITRVNHNRKTRTSHTPTRFRIDQVKTILYYQKKSTGIISVSRELAIYMSGSMTESVYSIHTPLTNNMLHRLKQYFSGATFISLEEYREMQKQAKPPGSRKIGARKEDHVVSTVVIGVNGNQPQQTVDMSTSSHFFHVVNNTGGSVADHDPTLAVYKDLWFSPLMIGKFVELYRDLFAAPEAIVLQTNKQTQKKIERSVPHISEMIEKMVVLITNNKKYHVDMVKWITRNRNVADDYYNTSAGYIITMVDLYEKIEWLNTVGIETSAMNHLTDKFSTDNNKIRAIAKFIGYMNNAIDGVYTTLVDEADALNRAANSRLREIHKTYPLIEEKHDYDYYRNTSLLTAWKDYVMMMDHFDNMKKEEKNEQAA